jgi:hypothetical protein
MKIRENCITGTFKICVPRQISLELQAKEDEIDGAKRVYGKN